MSVETLGTEPWWMTLSIVVVFLLITFGAYWWQVRTDVDREQAWPPVDPEAELDGDALDAMGRVTGRPRRSPEVRW